MELTAISMIETVSGSPDRSPDRSPIRPTRNIENLRQLRRVVKAARSRRIDMKTFRKFHLCGTTRCMAGFFAVDRWARKNTKIGEYFEANGEPVLNDSIGGSTRLANIKSALGEIFGLTDTEVIRVFYPYWNPPKRLLIDQIDRLIAGLDVLNYQETGD